MDLPGGQLAAALLVGLLVGVERGWQARTEPPGHRVAGVRTFGLFGLLGGAAGTLASGGWRSAATLLLAGGAAAAIAGYWRESASAAHRSATSAVAALLTLGLGAVATFGHPLEAIASASVTALLLASRGRLHLWLENLREADLHAGMRFMLIAAAIWPLLPDRQFGPMAVWNPRQLWTVVVLVTGFSFAGHVARARFGTNRGTFMTSALGGLYSSTAVIASLSTTLRGSERKQPAIIAGIAIASAVMFGRVLVLTAALAPRAVASLSLTIVPAAVIAVGWAAIAARRARDADGPSDEAEARNPVALLPALGFAAMVGVMALATRWAELRYGGPGAGAVIVATGSFDVDAAIITLRGVPASTLSNWNAGLVLAGPVLLNTLFKVGIVIVNGGRARWAASAPLLAAGAIMAVMLALAMLS